MLTRAEVLVRSSRGPREGTSRRGRVAGGTALPFITRSPSGETAPQPGQNSRPGISEAAQVAQGIGVVAVWVSGVTSAGTSASHRRLRSTPDARINFSRARGRELDGRGDPRE